MVEGGCEGGVSSNVDLMYPNEAADQHVVKDIILCGMKSSLGELSCWGHWGALGFRV
jgi:hypothetical protein